MPIDEIRKLRRWRLTEDAVKDQSVVDEARYVFASLKKFASNPRSLRRHAILGDSMNYVFGSKLGVRDKNLVISFTVDHRPKTKNSSRGFGGNTLGSFEIIGGNPVINLYIDRDDDDSIVEKLKDPETEHTFVHEYAHYMLWSQAKFRRPRYNNIEEYLRSPDEINSFYKEGISRLNDHLRKNPDVLKSSIVDVLPQIIFDFFIFVTVLDHKKKLQLIGRVAKHIRWFKNYI